MTRFTNAQSVTIDELAQNRFSWLASFIKQMQAQASWFLGIGKETKAKNRTMGAGYAVDELARVYAVLSRLGTATREQDQQLGSFQVQQRKLEREVQGQ